MQPIVIDDFLSKSYFSRIKEEIESNFFPWYFKKCITFPNNPEEDSLFSFGFENQIIYNGEVRNANVLSFLSGFYGQLLDISECSTIIKSRIDMVTYSPIKHKHTIHVDKYFPHIASIFYITDSDAETIIYDQKCSSLEQLKQIDKSSLKKIKEVEPRENRLLIFDGSYLHTGHSPSKYKNRIIINSDTVK